MTTPWEDAARHRERRLDRGDGGGPAIDAGDDVDDWVDQLSRGNVAQVKTVLATIVMALAVYQLGLMAVGYGKLRLPFLKPKAASYSISWM